MMLNEEKAVICGFPISVGNLTDNCNTILNCLDKENGLWVVTLNLEMIYQASIYEDYAVLLQRADLFLADGVPLIWASGLKKKTKRITGRSNGTDLVKKLISSTKTFRLGVIGGRDHASVVKNFNPDLLENAYFYDGRVDVDDASIIKQLISGVKRNRIDLLFLSLGVPKQDILASKIHSEIDSITIIGVGGAFDLLSGRKPRAPKWMQKNGLEWFHRLLTEPTRLAKRYIVHYPQALYYLIKDVI